MEVNKIYYPSVTKILTDTMPQERRDALDKWKESVGIENAESISTEAKKRGVDYDSMVKRFYDGEQIENNALAKHLSQYGCYSLEGEVVSKKHGFYGRYDIIFEVNNHLILNDNKGASKMKREEWLGDYPLQLSAYIKAFEETGKIISYGMISLILENDIQKFIFSRNQIDYYFNQFLKRLDKFNQLNK